MNEVSSLQNRRSARSNVLLKATLELEDASLPVVLRNLSEEGALVESDTLPEPGTRALFHRDGLSVPSRVAWSHCRHVGIEFDFPLFPRELLRHVPVGEKKPPPPIVRRPGLRPQPLTSAEMVMIEQWATESPTKLGE